MIYMLDTYIFDMVAIVNYNFVLPEDISHHTSLYMSQGYLYKRCLCTSHSRRQEGRRSISPIPLADGPGN